MVARQKEDEGKERKKGRGRLGGDDLRCFEKGKSKFETYESVPPLRNTLESLLPLLRDDKVEEVTPSQRLNVALDDALGAVAVRLTADDLDGDELGGVCGHDLFGAALLVRRFDHFVLAGEVDPWYTVRRVSPGPCLSGKGRRMECRRENRTKLKSQWVFQSRTMHRELRMQNALAGDHKLKVPASDAAFMTLEVCRGSAGEKK